MSNTERLGWLPVLAMLLAGCPTSPHGMPCDSDDMCMAGYFCGHGGCQLICREDVDCLETGAEYTCDDRGRCVPPVMCTEDVHCLDALFCNGHERCAPTEAGADSRGCVSSGNPCPDGITCDEAMHACAGCEVRDSDTDGFAAVACGGTDCDDHNSEIHPGATEVCDDHDVDEDCDPLSFGFRDRDGDGAASNACCNGTGPARQCGLDCNDDPTDPDASAIHGGMDEDCDHIDNDCDGMTDEGTMHDVFNDLDGDGYGASTSAHPGCAESLLPGEVAFGDDCDDANRMVHPTAIEVCNRHDDDCSSGGGTDTSEDADNDHHSSPMALCSGGYPKDDCDDHDASSAYGSAMSAWPDADGDGACDAPAASPSVFCGAIPMGYRESCPNGYADCAPRDGGHFMTVHSQVDHDHDRHCTSNASVDICCGTGGCDAVSGGCTGFVDCDDNQPSVYGTVACAQDADGDGYGVGSVSMCATACPSGYVTPGTPDCNDLNYYANPGVPDMCGERVLPDIGPLGHCCCLGCSEPDPLSRGRDGDCGIGWHINYCEYVPVSGGGSGDAYVVSPVPADGFGSAFTCGLTLYCNGCNGKTALIRPHCVPDTIHGR